MKELKLLIVEDDDKVLKSYERNIKSYNIEAKVKVFPIVIKGKDEAQAFLSNAENVIDAAIVDLDLVGSGGQDKSGNEVIRTIKNNLRFPVYVISGTPQNVDVDLKDESVFFKIKTRGEEGDYIADFVKIYDTGITQILNRKGDIEKYLNKIFWDHLSNSLDSWISDDSRSPETKQKTLLRYTLSHLQEYLEITEESNFENFHPSEIYITPPIKTFIFTGDIIKNKKDNRHFIVLTPSCDLAQAKAKKLLLSEIENPNSGILQDKVSILKKGKAKPQVLKESEETLGRLIHNAFSNKYHFLPKYRSINGGLINFQKITSITLEEFESDFEIVASLNSSFSKDIVARFSYYYSRQGSPDFDTKEIFDSLLN